jgi:cation diffusion facilitator family transporter
VLIRLAAWAARVSPRRLLMASIVVALATIALKTGAWAITGSVALLSDAMESLVNLAAAMFGFAMVTVAARPADDDHPYGHHKAEYFSSGFEGILIIVAALGIGWLAVNRLLSPAPIEEVGWGLALSVASSALNGALAWLMLQSARAHRSKALEADARHLLTDVWTTGGVIVGVGAVALTGWWWLDPVVAIAVALNIVKEGVHLMWESSQGLMDEAVEPEVQAQIQEVLDGFTHEPDGRSILRFDHVVTRKAGQRRFVDLHMHMPAHWSLGRAAALRASVEQALMAEVPGLRATISLLPTDVEAQSVQHPQS